MLAREDGSMVNKSAKKSACICFVRQSCLSLFDPADGAKAKLWLQPVSTAWNELNTDF